MATKPQREIRHIRRFYGFHLLSPDQLRICRSSFYDLCAELDATVGRVLKALRDTRFYDNTIIVLHTDHGTTLGEHGLGTIRTFYEPVVQVPFILSWPGHLPAARISDPVELVDMLPSLLDLAGLDCPPGVQGRSLVPQMLGRASDPHRPTFSEFDTSLAPIGDADWIPVDARWAPAHDRRVMVRRDGWKLECNYGPSDYGEDGALYDLRRDPFELDNLFLRPECATRVEELKAGTQEWLAKTAQTHDS
jgi:arylsulfatase A-like enzyme